MVGLAASLSLPEFVSSALWLCSSLSQQVESLFPHTLNLGCFFVHLGFGVFLGGWVLCVYGGGYVANRIPKGGVEPFLSLDFKSLGSLRIPSYAMGKSITGPWTTRDVWHSPYHSIWQPNM